MFEIMKILRKDSYSTDERINFTLLRPGSTVGFGFLPQRNISGCRMKVKSVNSYIFGEDAFLSHVLDNDGSDVNLIISKDEDTAGTILSLSQRVEPRFYSALFLNNQPESWFSMKPGQVLYTSHRVMGMQQSWVASQYKVVLSAEGTLLEGDHRLMKKPYPEELARNFRYALLVDDENAHALEAEQYEDGTLIVYSTVYRPATDIGEITSPVTPRETKLPSLGRPSEGQIELKQPRPLDEVIEKTAEVIALKTRINGTAPHSPATEEPQEQGEDTLCIDTKLAGRIINEAQSNSMSIANLIRKVIDLPAKIDDQVMVAFPLSASEYKELAVRYDLKADDHEGVKKHILSELQQFVGNKK